MAEPAADPYPHLRESPEYNNLEYAVVSVTHNAMPQKHEQGLSTFKLWSAHASLDAASRRARAIAADSAVNVILVQMRRWAYYPPTPAVVALPAEERDAAMEQAMNAYLRKQVENGIVFEERKKAMIQKIADDKEQALRYNRGEIDEIPRGEQAPEARECMDPYDENASRPVPPVLSERAHPVHCESRPEERFAIISIVPLLNVPEVPEMLAVKDALLYRIDAVIDDYEAAKAHCTYLREIKTNKHISIYILTIGGFVTMPPDDSRIKHENEPAEHTALRFGVGKETNKSLAAAIREAASLVAGPEAAADAFDHTGDESERH